jgi:hypothetical protein
MNSVGSSVAAWWALVDRIPTLRQHFEKRKPIFWSQDSHVMLEEELKFQERFSRVYVAHSKYQSKFRTACEFLPCSFTKCSIDDLLKLRQLRLPKNYDVVFYFEPYGARASTIRKMHRKLRHHKVWFGRTYGANPVLPFPNLLLLIKSARVVLNLSLKDDLNLRNFEALAADAILMADKTSDHDKVELDFRNVLFYQRSLEDFEDILQEALRRQAGTDASANILEKHMLISRYLDIINRATGLDLRLDVPSGAGARVYSRDRADRAAKWLDRSACSSVSCAQHVGGGPAAHRTAAAAASPKLRARPARDAAARRAPPSPVPGA